MRKILLSIALLTGLLPAVAQTQQPAEGDAAPTDFLRVYRPFNQVSFYDGYNDNIFDKDLEDGIIRHRNSLYAKRLTKDALDWFGLETRMDVQIGALCDNYDRIGNINLALVPKGAETYNPDEVTRLELARFITPFMNKNKMQGAVPYTYDAKLISMIMHDATLREKYDLWLEFEVFGIPYAANQQVTGCADRNDVFAGTLTFTCTDEPAADIDNHVLVPIVMKKPEYKGNNLNNYSEVATDTIGTTTKTYKFTVPEDVTDARITLIISNHGANLNGEEYVPRLHLVYFDKELVMTWQYGKNCEPYRVFNTQGNGIYGTYERSEFSWKYQSNWCPGDAIPTRYLDLGALKAGEHEVMIRVPEAVFADKQGDFPVSMYFQAVKSGSLPAEVAAVEADITEPTVVRNGDVLRLQNAAVSEISVYSYDGKFLYGRHTENPEMSLVGFEPGIYLVNFITAEGMTITHKAIKN